MAAAFDNGDVKLNSISPIWNSWLTTSRCIPNGNFNHVEYEEHADQRSGIADELRHVIEGHHARARDWTQILKAIGFPSLADALKRNDTPLPSRVTQPRKNGEGEEVELTTRRGNFCEVLATEFTLTHMGFEVPIRRLRYNPNPNQSMKGDDVLGFRFPEIHDQAAVMVGESKYRRDPSSISSIVKSVYDGFGRTHRSYPTSMDFVATILEREQEQERAQWVRQLRARLQSGRFPVERHYLIFLGTEGRPKAPFSWLTQQPDTLANITCVNVVFASGIQSWLDDLFGGN